MLEVVFREDGRQRPSSLRARGHADAGVHGEDIVCAAVSAVLQAARLGLEQHANVPLDATQRSGNLDLRWPETARDDPALQAIVATAHLAVAEIARQHPEHVRCRREPEIARN